MLNFSQVRITISTVEKERCLFNSNAKLVANLENVLSDMLNSSQTGCQDKNSSVKRKLNKELRES